MGLTEKQLKSLIDWAGKVSNPLSLEDTMLIQSMAEEILRLRSRVKVLEGALERVGHLFIKTERAGRWFHTEMCWCHGGFDSPTEFASDVQWKWAELAHEKAGGREGSRGAEPSAEGEHPPLSVDGAKCETCRGTGETRINIGGTSYPRTCQSCFGTGKAQGAPSSGGGGA
jgi:hypothetical protein